MSGAVGHTFLYNLIIIFILIVFGFLAGTMSYYKAFKINSIIVSSIEKYEGYNAASVEDINKHLTSLGYLSEEGWCDGKYKNMYLFGSMDSINYCIYTSPRLSLDIVNKNPYYVYGVLTFMTIDFPFIDQIKIPVFSKTRRIYNFETEKRPYDI